MVIRLSILLGNVSRLVGLVVIANVVVIKKKSWPPSLPSFNMILIFSVKLIKFLPRLLKIFKLISPVTTLSILFKNNLQVLPNGKPSSSMWMVRLISLPPSLIKSQNTLSGILIQSLSTAPKLNCKNISNSPWKIFLSATPSSSFRCF